MANEDQLRTYLKRVTAELHATRRRLASSQAKDSEPVAIVGMACRYPGGISSPDQLWELVADGGDAITEFPPDRDWDIDALYHPDPEHPGTSYTKHGGFLKDAADFDPAFFGISPREAQAMDPQQRLLLETAWEAFEHAGIDPATLRGAPVGVFTGIMHNDYASRLLHVPEDYEGHLGTGNTPSVASGRVAYVLGLEGPAVTIDTACSSSLVAIHLAAQALRSGEVTLVLAGGATVLSTPGVFVEFSRQGGLAADGRCKSFAGAADGVSWGEGVGLVLLERLSDAQRNGHRVLAVIRGSAINQDGASNGLTAPNGPSQRRVIGAALASAGISPADVDAVEAHGTGTTLGDPIEARALIAAYGQQRPEDRPLWLGSVKSNIGHTQAAAGVAGVIKMILAMQHGVLPKTLHVDQPTPHVNWEAGQVRLLTEAVAWPRNGHPRRAAVSSFGISGTNAHLILEQAPEPEPAEAPGTEPDETGPAPEPGLALSAAGPDQGGGRVPRFALPWLVSARTAPALAAQGRQLAAWSGEHPEADPADVAWTLAAGRAAFPRRAAVLDVDGAGRDAALAALAGGGEHPALVRGTAAGHGKVVLIFPGQGSQHPGMAAGLLSRPGPFAAHIAACQDALAPYITWSLPAVLNGDPGAPPLERPDVVQPALFAVMTGLAKLWAEHGIVPHAVAGHSQGEIAAACAAGILSLPDAAAAVALRSQALLPLAGGGDMAAVELPADRAAGLIAAWDGQLDIAVVNSPTATVISGTPAAVAALVSRCRQDGIRARVLPVGYASHGRQVEQLRDAITTALSGIRPRPGTVPFYSALTGARIDGTSLDAGYWYENLRGTVRFEAVTRALAAGGHGVFIEASPHPVLTAPVEQTLQDAAAPVLALPTLRRDHDDRGAFTAALAAAWASGLPVDWAPAYPARPARQDLPTYPFQRQAYWLHAAAATASPAQHGLADAGHPVLTAAIDHPDGTVTYTGRITSAAHPWTADHAVAGTVILPGTAFVDIAAHVGLGAGTPHIADLTLEAPLITGPGQAPAIQAVLDPPAPGGTRDIAVYSRPGPGAPWTRHATGQLAPQPAPAPFPDLTAWPPAGSTPLDTTGLYGQLADAGLGYGPAFQGVTSAWTHPDGTVYADIALPDGTSTDGHLIHPALLDAALHPAAALTGGAGNGSGPGGTAPRLAFEWAGITLHAAGATALRVRITTAGDGTLTLHAADPAGQPVTTITALTLRPLPADMTSQPVEQDAVFGLNWVPVPSAGRGEPLLSQLSMLGHFPRALARGLNSGQLPVDTYPGLDALLDAVDGGEPVPEVVIAHVGTAPAEEDPAALSGRSHATVTRTAELIQAWLADERLVSAQLVLVSSNAVVPEGVPYPGRGGSEVDLAGAAAWGLVRSAQAEHPHRISLIDLDHEPDSAGVLPAVVTSGEPQIAIRDGVAYAPRLTRTALEPNPAEAPAAASATTLVTIGHNPLGPALARHLAAQAPRRLLLAGQPGPGAADIATLAADLATRGAHVTITACDTGDRGQVRQLVTGIPAEYPLGTVHHAEMEADLETAWNLHLATEHLGLGRFVLHSSCAGTLGSPGQATAAATAAFLDALAARRHARGLAASSLAWGVPGSELAPVTSAQIQALLDAAVADGRPLLLLAALDKTAIRASVNAGTLPLILAQLAPTPGLRTAASRRAEPDTVASELAALPTDMRHRRLLDIVKTHVAAVLGHASGDDIDAEQSFKDLGFESLIAVKLRNRLSTALGVRLPVSLVFDYPTPVVLSRYLDSLVTGTETSLGQRVTPLSTAAANEPVAIIGMACRFPGGSQTLDDFWQLLADGTDAITPFPADRGWEIDDPADQDAEQTERYTPVGGFLSDAAAFDPAFFGISPREAMAMEPQQRLLLEVAWETLENAGIPPASLRGTATGVFAGAVGQEYAGGSAVIPADIATYLLTGNSSSVISGRVAYALGLEGPAVTVDTACSSSLVAIHFAMQALRSGETSLALAGGVTVMTLPRIFVEFARQRGLSADGRCKSFAAAADGTGWGEGVGLVALERLSDAQRNGHRVLAVIRGSAVNQDGASNGLTAPNGPSQQRVIATALAAAGLAPTDVDAIEAHGTGTRLGDPIEARALLAAYGQDRPADRPLWLGSLKSNIGHTQAAAGVAGVIKMILAMRHGLLPKTLHIDQPTPHVDWDSGQVRLLTEPVPWPRNGHPRRAGVSSFGVSGTNAHIIIEQAPEPEPAPADDDVPGTESELALPWLLSGRTGAALADQGRQLAAWAGEHPEADPADVAWTLAAGRAAFTHRATVTGSHAEALAALAEGAEHPALVRGTAAAERPVAFVLSGQGSQQPRMGAGLYAAFPVFAAALDAACAALDPYLDGPLRDVMHAEPGTPEAALLDLTGWAQPALFAHQAALAALLASYGITPRYLAGHSVGEITAAHLAGILALPDAARLVTARARLMQQQPPGGAMTAIAAPEHEITALLPGYPGTAIAAVNGPAATVISGDAGPVAALAAELAGRGHRTRPLRVSHAFHSPRMAPAAAALASAAASITFAPPLIPVVSTVTGALAGPGLLATPQYWAGQVTAPVRYGQAVTALAQAGAAVFIELGPDTTLTTLTRAVLDPGAAIPVIAAQDPRRPQAEALTSALATAWTSGLPVDWTPAYPPRPIQQDLPTYPFQRQAYWLHSVVPTASPASHGQAEAGHPILTAAIDQPDGTLICTGRISTAAHPWTSDHVVADTVLLSGTAFVDLAAHVGTRAGTPHIADLAIEAPLVIGQGQALAIQAVLAPPIQDGTRAVAIYSRPGPDAPWTRHANGQLTPEPAPAPFPDLTAWPPPEAEAADTSTLYDQLVAAGFNYGPTFRGVTAAWRHPDGATYAEVALPEGTDVSGHLIHPALLDASLHSSVLGSDDPGSETLLTFMWTGVTVHATGATRLRVKLTTVSGDTLTVQASDPVGQPVVTIASLGLRPLPTGQLTTAQPGARGSLYQVDWIPADPPAVNGGPGRCAIIGHHSPALGSALPGALAYPALGALHAALADDGGTAPDLVLASLGPSADHDDPAVALPARARAATAAALDLIQAWLASEPLAATRLVLLTRGATSAGNEDEIDPAAAAVWGLACSAQNENPGRITLIDLDDNPAAVPAVIIAGHPQAAIRAGQVLVPRLVTAPSDNEPASGDETAGTDPTLAGTVLVTGGTGGLGALTARHLAAQGAKAVLLASRRGPAAPGAAALAAGLAQAGTTVTVTACDTADPAAVVSLLAAIPGAAPLTAVYHAAGTVADATIPTLTHAHLDQVLRPKADAAWNLHEATAGLPVQRFVLFSSASGVLGAPGQGNYAAANTFLDALAGHRHARGLPATSLAWGYWAQETGTTSHLTAADRARINRGMAPIQNDQGMALLDAGSASRRPLLIACSFNLPALRDAAASGALPPILAGLAPAVPRRAATAASGSGAADLTVQLASLSPEERQQYLADLVQSNVAVVLGHSDPSRIDPAAPFKDLGLDSLTAVELRNRLSTATGLRLTATLIFDHPSPEAVARHLSTELAGRPAAAQLAPARRATAMDDEPIAIIGMACRYPGGVRTPEQLWGLLADGTDAISEFPDNRDWDLAALYDPDREQAGTTYVRHGGFLHDAADFDPTFFSISPREALATDPQQRLLLETAWETLERAGIDPAALRGTPVGVFTGIMYNDYGARMRSVPEELQGLMGNGSAPSVASGRVSYVLGLEGPAVTVDTACSSSLVTMHLGMQALRRGECTMALAGGATVMATPGVFVEFGRQSGLAPDGRSKSFAGAADGVAWGEGVGLVLLERLSDARRNGHAVLAVIRGSAVNQDGASNGLTAPNGPSQQRVITAALASAGLIPADVDAVEAHGTGTTLGDPIEAQAIIATYGQDRPEDKPLWLGAIKSNLGHTQAAAGVAGVIKMTLAMRHGLLPKTLHVDEPSPHVDWEAGQVRLLTEPVPWPETGHPRRAGVSSFGISGTNAHLILEQAPEPEPAAEPAAEPGETPGTEPELALPWLVSARTEAALAGQGRQLAAWAGEHPGTDPADVAWTLAAGRAMLTRRAAVTATDPAGRDAALTALAEGAEHPALVRGTATGNRAVAFVLSGQGSQQPRMGAGLYAAFPVFAAALDAACAALDPYLDGPLRDVMHAEPGTPEAALLDQTGWAQPALFAHQAALAALLASYGITPRYLAGHSVGEITAAHLAGILALPDAARLVTARARLMQQQPPGGAMTAIAAPEHEITALLGGYPGTAIAAVNGPAATVISGDAGPVAALAAELAGRGHRTRPLRVSHAFHSPRMAPAAARLAEAAAAISYGTPAVPVVSTVTGALAGPGLLATPQYWAGQVTAPVRYGQAVTALAQAGAAVFIELGPDTTLTTLTRAVLDPGAAIPVIAAQDPRRPQAEALTSALATAWTSGLPVDWTPAHPPRPARQDLPTYPFQRQAYWLHAPAATGSPASHGQAEAGHPILTAAIDQPDGTILYTGRVSAATHPWTGDHAIAGTVLLPGAAFVDMAAHAGTRARIPHIADLTLEAPLVIARGEAPAVQVVLDPPGPDGARAVAIYSRSGPDIPWTRHAAGELTSEPAPAPFPDLAAWPPAGAMAFDPAGLYEQSALAGLEYGPAFQGFRAGWRHPDGAVYAEITLPEHTEVAGYLVHPALLDSALHPSSTLSTKDEDNSGAPRLPFAWSGISVHATGATRLRVKLTAAPDGTLTVQAADPEGQPVVTVAALGLRPLPVGRLAAARPARDPLYQVDWIPADTPAVNGGPGRAAIIGHHPPALAAALPGTLAYPALDTLLTALAEDDTTVPDLAVAWLGTPPGQVDAPGAALPARARAATAAALDLIQAWLAIDQLTATRLVLLTRGAAATSDNDDTDPAAAAVWGLVRSAQSENPDRITLIDLDDEPAAAAVPAVVIAGYPQAAVRAGQLLIPRLAPAPRDSGTPDETPDGADLALAGTVLVTGGTGTLGALTARHVARHGARALLLASRRGPAAPGAASLAADLARAGTAVTVTACDTAAPAALRDLLGTIPHDAPLTAVYHTAGTVADATIPALTHAHLDEVMRPKADAAWNLHIATAGMPVERFVLFSSVAGVLGSPGQGNYAAANTFLDALAAHRHARGLPATSLAWGYWAQASGISGHLSAVDRARLNRGMAPIENDQGMALLDAAAANSRPLLVPVAFNLPALREAVMTGGLPPMLAGLVPAVPRQAATAGTAASLINQLAPLTPEERQQRLADLVRNNVATALAYPDPHAVDLGAAFTDLGFDSLTAVDLRNRLAAAAGLRLPATLIFDHPTPNALVGYLEKELAPDSTAVSRPVLTELEKLESMLSATTAESMDTAKITLRLEAILTQWKGIQERADGISAARQLESSSDDEVFDFIVNELGID